MTTTTTPTPLTPTPLTSSASSPLEHWTTVLPDALRLVTGHSPVVLLPPKFAGEPLTVCLCGGLLVYVRGAFRHTDACPACRNATDDSGSCLERHIGCSHPEPAECLHGCGQVVSLGDRCAWDRAPRSCCGCCWNLA